MYGHACEATPDQARPRGPESGPRTRVPKNPDSPEIDLREDLSSSPTSVALLELMADSDRRDSQIWSVVLVSLLVLSAGVVAIFAPNVAWGIQSVQLNLRYLPQLLSGLIVLIALFNFHVFAQRRALRSTRLALMEQIARADGAVASSFVDPLTGAFNRRYLDLALAREAKRAERAHSIFAVLMVDVDDLGPVNNKRGHTEGDRLLQNVAQVLRSVFRQSDIVVRYGGDEFLVILPDTDEGGAQIAIQRLSNRIAASNAANGSDDVDMSVSCGFAAYESGKAIEEVIRLADHRMYAQKAVKSRDGKHDLHAVLTDTSSAGDPVGPSGGEPLA